MFAVIALGNDYELLREGVTPEEIIEGTEYSNMGLQFAYV
jgi:hypothetical protein